MEIDRSRAGEVDEVLFYILWPDDRRSRIRFMDCYALEAKMNFGVVAEETVLSATEQVETDGIRLLRDKWGRVGVDLAEVKCFTFETNSTASIINVYARFWVSEPENQPAGHEGL